MISIKNLTKRYDKGMAIALNNINLDIEDGEFVSIMGTSGSGKSTLLNMIGGLDVPNEGTVNVMGEDLSKVNLSKYRRETVGFVFQLHNLVPNLTCVENVELPLFGSGVKSSEMKSRARNLLNAVGLDEFVNKHPNKLSGGQMQRVAIARALVNNPKIILADEPTGQLDSENSEIIMDLLQERQKETNAVLVVVTHDFEIAKRAGRIIKIRDGHIENSQEDLGVTDIDGITGLGDS
ncbi:MAG: ABC transporter ATP-binding protein [Methanobrevibacter sp.]|jgi:putative ABC transport system ATP-binding protein|nr:ABC transporter ATP-binding protein [Candidatus Methanovirga australis]